MSSPIYAHPNGRKQSRWTADVLDGELIADVEARLHAEAIAAGLEPVSVSVRSTTHVSVSLVAQEKEPCR